MNTSTRPKADVAHGWLSQTPTSFRQAVLDRSRCKGRGRRDDLCDRRSARRHVRPRLRRLQSVRRAGWARAYFSPFFSAPEPRSAKHPPISERPPDCRPLGRDREPEVLRSLRVDRRIPSRSPRHAAPPALSLGKLEITMSAIDGLMIRDSLPAVGRRAPAPRGTVAPLRPWAGAIRRAREQDDLGLDQDGPGARKHDPPQARRRRSLKTGKLSGGQHGFTDTLRAMLVE